MLFEPTDDDLFDAAVYVISVAADLAGMHPQTLRQYDRLGLVTPQRTRGRGRRYSRRDIAQLREVQRLSQEDGVNLAGIARIMDMERRLAALERENRQLKSALSAVQRQASRVFAAGVDGDVQTIRRGHRPAAPGTGRQGAGQQAAGQQGAGSQAANTVFRRGPLYLEAAPVSRALVHISAAASRDARRM